MMVAKRADRTAPAQAEESYQRWRDGLRSNLEYQAILEDEVAKSELWMKLGEARIAAGLPQDEIASRMGVTRAQVARIEERGYERCTIGTLRRYLEALGTGLSLKISIECNWDSE